jgi:hypothetical protein
MPVDTKAKHAELVRDRGGPEDPTIRDARKSAARPDSADAFLPDPMAGGGHGPLASDDAEWFAEEYIASATTGEPIMEDARDEVSEEEEGGPFLVLEAEPDYPETLPAPGEGPIERDAAAEASAARDARADIEAGAEITPRRNLRARHLRRPAPF